MPDLSLYEPTFPSLLPPHKDGAINLYVNSEVQHHAHFNRQRRVVFINGITNRPKDHMDSCLALSMLQFCPVIGVYNATGSNGKGSMLLNTLVDVGECITGKFKSYDQFRLLPQQQRAGFVTELLEANPAALSLFRLIRHKKYDIHAHSQGNYITSNTLRAIRALDGSAALDGRVVYTYGSPCGGWPSGIRLINMEFCWDPIPNLFQITSIQGVLRSFSGSITKVGNGVSHSFLEYMKHNPMFVLKRFEQGDPLGCVKSLEARGVALWAAQQGNNFRRVFAVFQLVEQFHRVNVANVCHHYMNGYGTNLNFQLNRSPEGQALRQFLKKHANAYKQKEFGLVA
ncbi:MAG: hypothetical protein KDK04_11750 [Candidatus Competibacteraceae bacterium]|nr:hypothetical protein [Candidatus Competibacteraceae bacterium]